jgi:hypothetical protein
VRSSLVLFFLLVTVVGQGQQTQPPPNPAQVDTPSELGKLKNTCGEFKIPGCVQELFTGQPIHIAVGSIAPQNGFGAGLAYVGHLNTDNWRTSWNADTIGSSNASWRAGIYAKFVHAGGKSIGIRFGTKDFKPNLTNLPEHTVYSLYAQAISLNKLTYFGLGSGTTQAGRSFYGMRETIIGGNVVKPVYEPLKVSLYGEINGRFIDLRPSNGQPSPSIQLLYVEATAPGLTTQPGTFQLGEGVRMTPVFYNDRVRLNYSATYQQYIASSSNFSFQRLTFDFSHQFAIYGKTTRLLVPRTGNGPDDCALNPADKHAVCPEAFTRNLEGSFGLRVFTTLSMTPGGDLVPFYFQPTLGGADINGQQSMSSYQDYRFRAPNLLLLRENFEHSIGKWPLGIAFMADQGKVGLTRGDLGSNNWVHSFSTGFTLRAGGFPVVYLLFSWGGSEGTHTLANVNTSLLGGSSRPSLY